MQAIYPPSKNQSQPTPTATLIETTIQHQTTPPSPDLQSTCVGYKQPSRIALLMLLFGAGAQLVLRIAASLSRHDTKQASSIICLSLVVYRIASCFWTERLTVYAVIKVLMCSSTDMLAFWPKTDPHIDICLQTHKTK